MPNATPTDACTDNPSKLRSSLKRADANSRNEFSRTITIRIYRVAEVIRYRLLNLSLAFEQIMSSTRKIRAKIVLPRLILSLIFISNFLCEERLCESH